MMKTFALLTALAFCLLTEVSAKDVHKELDVKPGQKLEMNSKSGGDIEISSWDEDKVSVDAKLEGRDGEDPDLSINPVSGGVEITTEYSHDHHDWQGKVEFRIKVPKKFDLDLTSSGGEFRLDGVEGTLEGTTMGGQLHLSNLTGKITFKTMGGDITVSKSHCDGKVTTMGGQVRIEDVVGNVDGETMGGSVTYENVKGIQHESGGQEIRTRSKGGEITVDDAPNGADLETMGGDITVHTAQKYVKARTMGGNIEIGSVDGGLHLVTMGGNVSATMTGDAANGDRDVYISSMGGDITLIVPDKFSMDIDLTIAYTKDGEIHGEHGKPQIVSDFNLAQNESTDWEHEHGTPRKYIYGKASVAGGKNKIHIETINGDVSIKKAGDAK